MIAWASLSVAASAMPLAARLDYVLALALLLPACSSDTLTESGADADVSDGSDKPRDAGVSPDGQAGDAKVLLDASFSKPDRIPFVVPSESDAGNCDTALEITIRDFTEKHPDFEHYTAQVMGIVQSELGPDKKPVYASTGSTAASTGPAEFKQWYNDVDGVNMRLSYKLQFTEQSDGVYVFDSSAFFPIDNMGFGNGPKGGGVNIPLLGTIGGGTPEHNFLFTTEAHTVFLYRGGETFKFTGDDDLWVFLNNKLAIDLGGTHSALSAMVDLDAEAAKLGLEKGKSYPMDIFHAERHTNQSNYHIETTIDLSCIENVPIPYI